MDYCSDPSRKLVTWHRLSAYHFSKRGEISRVLFAKTVRGLNKAVKIDSIQSNKTRKYIDDS